MGSLSSFFSIGTWVVAIGGALLLLVAYDASKGATAHDGRTARV